jgi:primosomal protein N' (replication factor Y)
MSYYEVFVASQRYHKPTPLTYASPENLAIGAVVEVPLQNERVVGFVVRKVNAPRFPTKAILRSIHCTLPAQTLQLHQWLLEYYPAPSGFISQLFLPSSLTVKLHEPSEILSQKLKTPPLPPLTDAQTEAIQRIRAASPRSVLLHGDTGTGKTRIYIELVKVAIEEGKSAIVLTPEIILTPQLVDNFEAAFPGKVITVHSTLTAAERRDAWLTIARADTPLVIIGPRSALLSPLKNLGLIIMDEAHDSAYKQEQAPYYQTSRVAGRLAELHHAQLIMGTATPNISDYYAFEKKQLPIIRMTTPAISTVHPAIVTLVDLRDKEQMSRSPWLSEALISAVNSALQHNKQSLVFLNRRGTARLVLCQDCGWQSLCPRCDLPLTYHADTHMLRCHTCGFTSSAPSNCNNCGSANIIFKSIGTKALTEELTKLFPKANVQRFDSDSSKSERLENNYASVVSGGVDILVGTQMLTKGLDLPKLAVVGVVIADTGLYFPDYTAEERTFQMLTQVMGRVGRGHGMSTIVIQTYSPDSPSITHAVQKIILNSTRPNWLSAKTSRFHPFAIPSSLSAPARPRPRRKKQPHNSHKY